MQPRDSATGTPTVAEVADLLDRWDEAGRLFDTVRAEILERPNVIDDDAVDLVEQLLKSLRSAVTARTAISVLSWQLVVDGLHHRRARQGVPDPSTVARAQQEWSL